MTASRQYAARIETAAVAAMAGLLADHKDHAEELQPGESCPQAVARLAIAHARELIKAIDRETILHREAEMLARETPGDDAITT